MTKSDTVQSQIETASRRADKYSRLAPVAMLRLARASYGNDNAQAQIVSSWLAALYNGADSPPVSLLDFQRLDWALREDLVTVLMGINHGGCEDYLIRRAFEEVAGGPKGADWLHRWVDRGKATDPFEGTSDTFNP